MKQDGDWKLADEKSLQQEEKEEEEEDDDAGNFNDVVLELDFTHDYLINSRCSDLPSAASSSLAGARFYCS